ITLTEKKERLDVWLWVISAVQEKI
ncbi:hypothetical protein LCGC14_2391790, partial [marine sediment metagenome]